MVIIAFLGGTLPALIWLIFWLSEDRKNPEPKSLITLAFIGGMIAVPFTLPLEKLIYDSILNGTAVEQAAASAPMAALVAVALWAIIEELLKFGAAYVLVLKNKEVDEPTDYVIYMISIALGFAALENTLFLIHPLLSGNALLSVVTGNLRFVGATLLHVISSAAIGVFMAFAFYKTRHFKKLYTVFGVILAIALHTLFNFFILNRHGGGSILAFGVVWLSVIVLILMFEKVRRIHPVPEQKI